MTSMLSEIFVPLHRIIPFSNVEGQGNRTSIFLQGCKLNCLYCHNPETIPRHTPEAKLVSLQYLFDQVMNAVPFIRGVTVSGGEPTIHQHKLVPLFQALRQQGLSCYLDSSGFFEYKRTQALIDVTDKFLFDLKGIGSGLHALCFDRQNKQGRVSQSLIPIRQIKTENLQRNLSNLALLLAQNKIEEVRLVFINGFFDNYQLVNTVATLLRPYPEVLFKLIRVHSKGARDEQGLTAHIPTIAETDQLAAFAKQCGIKNTMTIY